MVLDNDTRGWIMASVSGVACIVGASIICIDILVRLIPRFRNFKIQDSNGFLASSLSLSFGVMLFSALYNMLPSSKTSLIRGGMSSTAAAYTMISCFLGGVIGIQFLSVVLHHFIPSHVVDCDHAHKDQGAKEDHRERRSSDTENQDSDDRPLLSRDDYESSRHERSWSKPITETRQKPDAPRLALQNSRRPSLQALRSFITAPSKRQCDEGGPCFGYSNPCGNECYRIISQSKSMGIGGKRRQLRHSHTAGQTPARSYQGTKPTPLGSVEEQHSTHRAQNGGSYGSLGRGNWESRKSWAADSEDGEDSNYEDDGHGHEHSHKPGDGSNHHHHHVASNAFLSIGLQTSIAIALHKLPEGFITYATNHANPKLGFSVFMALFIHNITEGFALALPLYLAVNSRIKAMIAASILGGASQPLGAGIAVLWLRVAQSRDMTPNEGVYGVMFAITSGIMTSVALQLFSESMTLTHNKALCIAFGFVGMGILGFSNALTA